MFYVEAEIERKLEKWRICPVLIFSIASALDKSRIDSADQQLRLPFVLWETWTRYGEWSASPLDPIRICTGVFLTVDNPFWFTWTWGFWAQQKIQCFYWSPQAF